MIRSKATAALMRLKEMDEKYKVRYRDEKQGTSSENTESLLEQDEYKNTKIESDKIITLASAEKPEILKPTLNIKIPDAYTEQLKSHSMSDKASPSLRVSVVDKTPVVTPRVETQSISEIHEDLDDAESIDEALEDSDSSDSEVTKQSIESEVKKLESKNDSLPTTAEKTSDEKKQSQDYEDTLKDVQSNDYSRDSFESYSSVAKSLSSTHSSKKESKSKTVSLKSSISKGNDSISVLNTKTDVTLHKEGGEPEIFVERIGKENTTEISKNTETADADNNSKTADQEETETSWKSNKDTSPSSAKLEQDCTKTDDSELADEIANDEKVSSSAKDANSSVGKFDNDKTILSISEQETKRSTLQSQRRSKKHEKKSSNHSEVIGKVPKSDTVESESSSRQRSSRGGKEHRSATLERRAEEIGIPKTVDKTLQRSLSAIETGNKPKNLSKRVNHHRSKICDHEATKSSTFGRISDENHRERYDRELENLKMRMRNLQLEQERQLMLRYAKDFEEDRERLSLWPNNFYCPGKSRDSIVKPLNFPNVLNYTKPDSTSAEAALNLPDSHLTMLKNRVAEIRQWLKDQFELYRDYSEVAAAINAKYVAEAEKLSIS